MACTKQKPQRYTWDVLVCAFACIAVLVSKRNPLQCDTCCGQHLGGKTSKEPSLSNGQPYFLKRAHLDLSQLFQSPNGPLCVGCVAIHRNLLKRGTRKLTVTTLKKGNKRRLLTAPRRRTPDAGTAARRRPLLLAAATTTLAQQEGKNGEITDREMAMASASVENLSW